MFLIGVTYTVTRNFKTAHETNVSHKSIYVRYDLWIADGINKINSYVEKKLALISLYNIFFGYLAVNRWIEGSKIIRVCDSLGVEKKTIKLVENYQNLLENYKSIGPIDNN